MNGRERLQPSLLDRLTDHSPAQKNDSPDQRLLTTAQLRQAVLRDLSALFNTTNLATLEDLSGAKLVANSTLNYGIPGFAGMIESPARRAALEREMATAIKAFEPRIRPQTLRVRARDARVRGMIVLEIEGELWAQPMPVSLFLETAIDIETRRAVVTESKGSR